MKMVISGQKTFGTTAEFLLDAIQIIGGAAGQVAEWVASNRPIDQSSPTA